MQQTIDIENKILNLNFTLKSSISGLEYQFVEQIGQGSEGQVYKARVKTTREIVAIKISSFQSQNKEVQKLNQCKFKHILNLWEIIVYNQNVYTVMDHADGEFHKFMQTQEYLNKSKEEKNRLFLQIVKGVEELHLQQLIHRDLKPENVLYFRQENGDILLKLCDFGLLKNSADFRKTPNIGTPYYWAQEMISDNSQAFYTNQVDIWALGMVWYEMLIGKPMFYTFNTVESLRDHLKNLTQQQINNNIDQLQEFDVYEKELLKKRILLVKNQQIQRITASQLVSELQQKLDSKSMFEQLKQNSQIIVQCGQRLEVLESFKVDPLEIQDLKKQVNDSILKLEESDKKHLALHSNQSEISKKLTFLEKECEKNQDLVQKVTKFEEDLSQQNKINFNQIQDLKNKMQQEYNLITEQYSKQLNDQVKKFDNLEMEFLNYINQQKMEQKLVEERLLSQQKEYSQNFIINKNEIKELKDQIKYLLQEIKEDKQQQNQNQSEIQKFLKGISDLQNQINEQKKDQQFQIQQQQNNQIKESQNLNDKISKLQIENNELISQQKINDQKQKEEILLLNNQLKLKEQEIEQLKQQLQSIEIQQAQQFQQNLSMTIQILEQLEQYHFQEFKLLFQDNELKQEQENKKYFLFLDSQKSKISEKIKELQEFTYLKENKIVQTSFWDQNLQSFLAYIKNNLSDIVKNPRPIQFVNKSDIQQSIKMAQLLNKDYILKIDVVLRQTKESQFNQQYTRQFTFDTTKQIVDESQIINQLFNQNEYYLNKRKVNTISQMNQLIKNVLNFDFLIQPKYLNQKKIYDEKINQSQRDDIPNNSMNEKKIQQQISQNQLQKPFIQSEGTPNNKEVTINDIKLINFPSQINLSNLQADPNKRGRSADQKKKYSEKPAQAQQNTRLVGHKMNDYLQQKIEK